ncbi:MAG: CoA transferase [Proteobacteria bacterium]|nr:CoA transferase [Pseudomonadota bacterium]
MTSPLTNIRVLDMSRILAGPWAGQLLGDYGADVIKIEKPLSGDDTRHWGPPWLDGNAGGESAYFLSANRNKRSVTIDISLRAGQQVIRDLAKQADVLLENYKVGTLSRYGLGPDDLLDENPELIYCSISAFGQSGSRAQQPGYDAMIQASAGLMSITGDADAGPQKVGVAISDIMAGMYAATAVLAALNSRVVTGKGQHIDVPLYDSQVAWLANQNMNFLIGGETPERMGTAHPNLVPYQVFATLDGSLMLTVGNDRQFADCCTVLGMPELARDSRFSSMSRRIRHREELIALLEAKFKERNTTTWLDSLQERGVPASAVNDIAEVLTNEHAAERELVRYMRNSRGAEIPLVANPVEFQHTPVSYRAPPPLLGEHTHEVLQQWLGYSDEHINALRQKEVL